jgi:hypothetical protein
MMVLAVINLFGVEGGGRQAAAAGWSTDRLRRAGGALWPG